MDIMIIFRHLRLFLIHSKQKLSELEAEGKILKEEKETYLKLITTTESFEDFKTCDLVIECVFENEMVKSKVTKESEMHMDEYAFLASNTISIPITKLAKSSIRPESYVGLHFFAPAEDVPLVEIVKGEQTSEETIARAFDFVKKIRKTPIIVKDSWGFFASRVQNTYILEGLIMLEEGYPPALIENLGLQAGMPMGVVSRLRQDFMITLIRIIRYFGKNWANIFQIPLKIIKPKILLIASYLHR